LFGHFVLAGILVSLAACLVAFALLYRIAEDKLGSEGARRAVLYLAVFPMSVFLQAVYTESLYLALVLAAFFFAERQRWLNAWIATGLAVLTRSSGVALVPAIVLLAWRAPNRRRAFAGLPLVPALFSVFPLVLRQQTGDPWGFLHADAARHFAPGGPLAGIWAGVHAGITGVGSLLTEGPALRTSTATGSDYQVYLAAFNVQALVFLAVFAVLAVIAWRRFGDAYGLFAGVSLALPLSTPVSGIGMPLQSLPRYMMVIFPCFLALAWIGRRPRLHTVIVAVSSILLGLSVVQWSLWQWVG
jgi:4-amino-4-deoxy-L-arabinose transferase-like glycosyltransferase